MGAALCAFAQPKGIVAVRTDVLSFLSRDQSASCSFSLKPVKSSEIHSACADAISAKAARPCSVRRTRTARRSSSGTLRSIKSCLGQPLDQPRHIAVRDHHAA